MGANVAIIILIISIIFSRNLAQDNNYRVKKWINTLWVKLPIPPFPPKKKKKT